MSTLPAPPASEPIVRGGPFETLFLRREANRLTLSSRGPVARWLHPVLNTLPAVVLLPTVAAFAVIASSVMQQPPAAASGSAVGPIAVSAVAGLLPPLLVWLLLWFAGVGRGFSLTLDSEDRRCRLIRHRTGLPAKRNDCELDDLRLKVNHHGRHHQTAAAANAPGGGAGVLRAVGFLLTLLNPLGLIVLLAMRGSRRRTPTGPVDDLRIWFGGLAPLHGRIDTQGAGTAAAIDLATAWFYASKDRFRFGFERRAAPSA